MSIKKIVRNYRFPPQAKNTFLKKNEPINGTEENELLV